MVSTLDSESSDPSSNLGGTYKYFLYFAVFLRALGTWERSFMPALFYRVKKQQFIFGSLVDNLVSQCKDSTVEWTVMAIWIILQISSNFIIIIIIIIIIMIMIIIIIVICLMSTWWTDQTRHSLISLPAPWCNGQHSGLWIQRSEFKSRWDLYFKVILKQMYIFLQCVSSFVTQNLPNSADLEIVMVKTNWGFLKCSWVFLVLLQWVQ